MTPSEYRGTPSLLRKFQKSVSTLPRFLHRGVAGNRNQIITYHNDSKSSYYYGGEHKALRTSRPVQNVLVFTPDVFPDKDFPDNCVTLHTYKITEDRYYIEKCGNKILELIRSYVDDAEEFYSQTGAVQSNDR